MKHNQARIPSVGILYLYTMIIVTIIFAMTSCANTKKYYNCDAYKTHYKPIKAEKHRHALCDAYN